MSKIFRVEIRVIGTQTWDETQLLGAEDFYTLFIEHYEKSGTC